MKEKAFNHIIATEQKILYPNVYEFLDSEETILKDIPDLIKRYKLYRDSNNILRIRSKYSNDHSLNPIFFLKYGQLTERIIRNTHDNLYHSGVYAVLKDLRRKFFISDDFSATEKVLNSCVTCRKITRIPWQLDGKISMNIEAGKIHSPKNYELLPRASQPNDAAMSKIY